MDEQLWGFYNATWVFVATSYTTSIVSTLPVVTLLTTMFFTFEILLAIFDVVKSKKLESILPTLSIISTKWNFLLPIAQQKPDTLPTFIPLFMF